MKTTEQIKTEVVNYLTKVSKHLYEYNGLYYKIMLDESNNCVIIHGDSLRKINIDNLISYHAQYTKVVLKHMLFLNKKVKAIKIHKAANEQIKKVIENVK